MANMSEEFENNVKIRLSEIISQISDKSIEGLIREIMFTQDINWKDVYVFIKKHRPEEVQNGKI